MKRKLWYLLTGLALMGTLAFGQAEVAEVVTEAAEAVEEVAEEVDYFTDAKQLAIAIDNLFLMICAVLVIFMQAGFAILESGVNHSKNTVNILMKNVMDFSLGVLLYFFIGYGIMYGDGNGYFAMPSVFGPTEVAPAGEYTTAAQVEADFEMDWSLFSTQVDFLFQVAFAATAATIVSGAVAGRMKFAAYLIYTAVLTGFIYPLSGYWTWGEGWLDAMGFHDFAGSVIVHAVGGFAGLAGAIVLGPRIGRFGKDKTPMPGHNLTFASLGVFILLVGWYGFNPGSVLTFTSIDAIQNTMLVALNTTLAAAAGAVFALITSWILDKKPDLTMALNGILAGLVSITANADIVTNMSAIIIGLLGGILVVGGIKLLEAVKIDDPVGAWPVHGLCGIWGVIAAGIFGGAPMGAQIAGAIAIPLYAFVTMFILFSILKAVGVLRVSEEDEMIGLDLSEHGQSAYGD
ncbi:MAG: ammonium transporter [Verrucomicrobia bacterium]|nr:ammonium transporter [Verrucomicrobiota bacterium]MCH8510932.1 ammonium transporter [Kiritimatiellia bacterium]